MRFEGVLFDLDGTLVDSAEDMYMALNLTLSELAYPIVSHALVREWVGNGIDALVQRGLSGSYEISDNLEPEYVAKPSHVLNTIMLSWWGNMQFCIVMLRPR